MDKLSGLVCLFVLSIFLLLPGCVTEQFPVTTDLEKFQEKYKEKEDGVRRLGENPPAAVTAVSEVDGDYRLGPGDLIAVRVYESDELSTEARVSSSGFVSLPLLNNVEVNNLSAAEAEYKIENLYKQKYLKDPHVSVYIKAYVSKKVTLVGAVKKPGSYEYLTQRRLLDVLALANGLDDSAGSIAYVDRSDLAKQKNVRFLVDIDALLKKGDMSQNIVILGGDIIIVPEAGQFFADGAVRKPGLYPLRSNMTITEAIALAGGLVSFADNDGVKLIRYMGRGKKREIVSLSYSELQSGLGDTLLLQDQDVVFVESSPLGLLISGTGLSFDVWEIGFSFKNPETMLDN